MKQCGKAARRICARQCKLIGTCALGVNGDMAGTHMATVGVKGLTAFGGTVTTDSLALSDRTPLLFNAFEQFKVMQGY